MGSITIKVLIQSLNSSQITKKTIQLHIPKDLLKILNDTPTTPLNENKSITCAKGGKLGFEYRGSPCCKDAKVHSYDMRSIRPKIFKK